MLKSLFAHMAWADSIVWRAVLAVPDDHQLKEKLHHVHTVQYVYLALWQGRDAQLTALEAFTTTAELLPWARAAHRDMAAYLATVDESSTALDETMEVPWSKRVEQRLGRPIHPITRRESLIQVPEHSTYHRGQVNTRLRELGGEPPLTDFVAWVWFGKPAAEWPT